MTLRNRPRGPWSVLLLAALAAGLFLSAPFLAAQQSAIPLGTRPAAEAAPVADEAGPREVAARAIPRTGRQVIGAPRGPDEYQVGTPWFGDVGITESVADIVARQAAAPEPVLKGGRGKHFLLPRKVRHNPRAPAVASWPVADATAAAPAAPLAPQTIGTSFLAVRLQQAGFIPPDSIGDVGPTQIVVVVNGRIRVFSKTGVLGPLDVSTDVFFASVADSWGTTDPHVRYDRLSGRWFVVMINTRLPGPNRVLVAVSSGPEITSAASFTFFQFQQDLPGGAPNADTNAFADYPTLGVDRFALYVGVNIFNQNATAFLGTTGFVINKANLIGGMLTVTAFRQLATVVGAPTKGPLTPQGVHNDDPAATEGYFAGVDLLAFSEIVLRRVTNPGGTPAISGNLIVVVPTTSSPIDQPAGGSLVPLDALDDRLYAAQIKRHVPSGTVRLWTAHNIAVDSSGVATSNASVARNASRWYSIGSLTTTPALVQSGTLFDPNPPATAFGYWIPAIAASGQGHVALGASRASPDTFASAVTAGRLSGDAAGTLRAPEVIAAGAGTYNVQTSVSKQRWGDFSQTVVDPVDDMTMWTFQEYADATNSWAVRAVQLRAPPPATIVSATPSTIAANQASVNVVISGSAPSGEGFFDPGPDTGGPGFAARLQVTIPGVTVNSITFTSPTQLTVNLSTVGATAGARNVTVTNPDGQFRTATNLITVTGSPLPVAATSSLSTESCVPNNGLLDPGEVVTVSLGIQNAGAVATSNLVGTLQATGGVTLPGSAQNYGAIAPGATVSRSFTFRVAGAPGGTLTATLALQDGGTNHGTVTFDFALTGAAFRQNFDGVTAPALSPGWTGALVVPQAGDVEWRTVALGPVVTIPNAVFAAGPDHVADNRLQSPSIAVATSTARLTFWHRYDLENARDGGVLELSIDGAPFQDVLLLGGSFTSGGYTGTMANDSESPILNRQAWTGTSAGFVRAVVALPATLAGKTVRLRWRLATDNANASAGWWVDDVAVADVASCGIPAIAGDVTGNGMADVAVFRPQTASVLMPSESPLVGGTAASVPVAGDFDGDRRTDVGLFDRSTGTWTRVATSPVQFGAPGDIPAAADYDGDGITDVAVFRPANGAWFVRNRFSVVFGAPGDVPVPGDYLGDGRADVAVYRRATGVWYQFGAPAVQFGAPGDVPVPADYDGNGTTDIAVFRPSTGVWYVRNQLTRQFGAPGDVPMPIDVNGDGRAELVVWRPATGTWFWFDTQALSGGAQQWGQAGDAPVFAPAWLLRSTFGDADGDRRADPGVFRPGTGVWSLLRSSSGFSTFVERAWGLGGDRLVAGDYDGDRRLDPAVFRPSVGTWYVTFSSTGYSTSTFRQFGASTDLPVAGDYDGDGKDDYVVYRPSTGVWYGLHSSSGFASGFTVAWGASGDVPLSADFDGDGRTDLAVFRPSTTTWFVRLSSTGYATSRAFVFGASDDLPAPADVDGDGLADLLVFRPSTGLWYLSGSAGGYATTTPIGPFGTATDLPVVADYDGDGRADLGVYEPSTSTWYARMLFTVVWGSAGDQPVLRRP